MLGYLLQDQLSERLDCKETGVFLRLRFALLGPNLCFFFLAAVVFDFSTDLLYTFQPIMHCSQQNKGRSAHQWVPFTVHGPTNITFQQLFFIKNGSHDTIHTFKNYFATVFSVFNFSNFQFQ